MEDKTRAFAEQVAKEVYKMCKKEERMKTRSNWLHNTGLLMIRYCELKEHYENIKYKASDVIELMVDEYLDPDDLHLVNQDDVVIHSIKKSKVRTFIVISQIEACIEILEAAMRKRGQIEKIKVLKRLYMNDELKDIKFNERVKLVSEQMTEEGMPCSESSVRRWANEMLNEISVKLFGVDGLKLDI